MAPKRPARSGLIAIAPSIRRTAIGLCCSIVAAIVVTIFATCWAVANPAVSENVPLPVPAPLPKTGTAPPPAAAKPATETRQTPSLFPFSALFGNKSSTATPAPSAPEPPSPFDAKQRALLDRISNYLSSVQTMVGKFVQVGPDGGRTEGTFYMQKPGRVHFEYNPPSPIDIISDGSSVVVRSSTILRPLHCLSAACRESARPAPWHAEANAFFSAVASPTRMYEPVPMLPPMRTGCPTRRNASGKLGCPGPKARVAPLR